VKLYELATPGHLIEKVLFPNVEEMLKVELYIEKEYKLNLAPLNVTG
jgi:hypothetical protein